ncbi:hypothetical protein [Floricoccus penangensis]|uniref:YxeA family protein n=1 Tax=Floricoccus penangensis TaxID=1859475 RepID=A0A9Q5P0Q6_9LACT|nr:hypothetical protein [Floricoccus penangensis]OFI48003.1 hypothetical protein BG262_00415 [Floricoccus penangensis]URZ87532.1 hypothetical protein KIW23_00305 [Floricoccus penangensis]
MKSRFLVPILTLGTIVLLVFAFFTFYQNKNEIVDRINPLMKMTYGYATLPPEVTYNGGKAYVEKSSQTQIPDNYVEPVYDKAGKKPHTLTFSGGQSPEGKNYGKLEHKGTYVKYLEFVSWDEIPKDLQKVMNKEYKK